MPIRLNLENGIEVVLPQTLSTGPHVGADIVANPTEYIQGLDSEFSSMANSDPSKLPPVVHTLVDAIHKAAAEATAAANESTDSLTRTT